MRIYISGISGTGMGPLALMAKAAGYEVVGSDLAKGAIYDELVAAGIEVMVGVQDGGFLKKEIAKGIDWFVYTSALPDDHAELVLAKKNNLKTTKRDELTAFLIKELKLKMVAAAGTHGKTTTTAMIVWAAKKLNLPVSYIVGTTLDFAPSGDYDKNSRFFVYEADEYDRNFLKFHPWLALILCVSYDHPDIYPTRKDYEEAFAQFEKQSEMVIRRGWVPERFNLSGEARRIDAGFAAAAIKEMAPDMEEDKIIAVLNEFPGAGRRFEKIAEGLYSDYAHHPEEIAKTIEIAREEATKIGKTGVVAIYQPHQNTRQHEVKEGYREAFIGADKVIWLPTYLTREDPGLEILSPETLMGILVNKDVAEEAELDQDLEKKIKEYLAENYLVILMTAGPANDWLRER